MPVPVRHRHAVLAGLGLLGATLVFTWPIPARLATHLAGGAGDNFIFYWNLWWFREALWHAPQWPFATHLLFHPQGASLAYHTTTLLSTVPGLVLGLALPLPVAFNVMVLGCFFFAGAAMYALAREVLSNGGGGDATTGVLAFFAALAYAFAPFHMAHVGHLNILNVGVVPLAAWAFLRLEARPSVRRALVLGACLAAAALADGYHAWAATLLVVTLAVMAWRRRGDPQGSRPARPSATRLAAIVAGSFAALAWPVWVPMLQYGARALQDIQAGGANDYVADLAAWVLPSPFHPLWNIWLEHLYSHLSGNLAESVVFPTFTVWALAIVGWRRGGSAARRWLWVAVVFGMLSLGPFLHVGGRDAIEMGGGRFLRLPLPKVLLDQLPLLSGARGASRFASVVQMAFVLAATLGLAHWVRGGRVPARAAAPRRARFAIAFACLCFECAAWPLPTTRIDIPAAYIALAADARLQGKPGALLEIPPVHAGDKVYQLYQTVHGLPLLGGRLARVSYTGYDRLHRDPFLDRVLSHEPWGINDGTLSLAGLDSLGVKYVMLHRGLTSNPAIVRLLAARFEPVAAPGDAQLYRRRAPAPLQPPRN
jgi:hypothetical protein